ncbi:MAG TPA: FAD-dependent oxidoreductase, partial [Burkholderiaceae bacterium]|nr:FAD-dependent oxidoreductase [Burkholderiaceae bacterium]
MTPGAQDFDVIVIGAGIAGASVASFLARHGKVAIVEREAQPGHHSTGRSAAVFAPSYGPPQVRALTRASRAYFDAVPGVLAPRGTLFVARAERVARLHALADRLAVEGAPARVLDGAGARDLVPVLRPEASVAALRDDNASDIDVHALHQHFLRSAKAERAELHTGFDVQRL